MSNQTKLNIVLTIEQAVTVESALHAAIFNAQAQRDAAERMNLPMIAKHRQLDVVRAEQILKTFSQAFMAATAKETA